MTTQRTLLTLGGITLVMSLAALGFSLFGNRQDMVQPGGLAFPGLSGQLASIDRLDIASGGATFTLQRDAGTWVAADKGGYPANNELITEALIGLSRLTLEEPRTADASLYSRLEVQDPVTTSSALRITAKIGDTEAADLIVGKARLAGLGGGKEAHYVRREGEAQAWLAAGTLKLEKEHVRWLQRTIIDLNRDRIAEAQITGPGRSDLVVNRPNAETENFAIANLPATRKVEQAWRVNNIASALELLDFEDVRVDPKTGSPIGTAKFTSFDGLVIITSLVKVDERTWLRLSASTANTASEPVKREADIINGRAQNWLFRVPAYKEERFTATLDSLTVPAGAS